MLERPVVIGGGVGPMAGVALHARIIEHTATDGTDQSHLTVLHFSSSSRIPDRTAFLLGKEELNPALGMVEVFQGAWEALKALGYGPGGAVAGIPCNTFHAPQIFNLFLEELSKRSIPIQVLHMLEETVQFIEEQFPHAHRVGVLSTTGTRKTEIYHTLLEKWGYQVVEVPMDWQDKVQEAIYDPSWGIKAKSPVTAKARDQVLDAIQILLDSSAEVVILGCTELPLAVPEREVERVPLVDPMVALARALIRKAAPSKLAPYERIRF
ncbi:MAG: amino acid racemase [Spirochaetes bacterium]|nr:amino acid racemase [Spirochaetota bacterium]